MIKPKFTSDYLKRVIAQKMKDIDEEIVRRFVSVGKAFVKDAKNNGSYEDRTGDLRRTICYVVCFNGAQRSKDPIPKEAKSLIDELIARFPNGYVLIVAAPMFYAGYVESKGRNVLTGSSFQAKADLRKAFKDFKH